MNVIQARSLVLTAALFGALTACARREALPGDSVPPDGGVVSVAPARVPAEGPAPAPKTDCTKEPLGAIESRVFPPELIMEHQAAIALDDKQRATIMAEAERAQKDMRAVRWDLEREREALAKLLDSDPLDETKIASSATKLTELESKIKAVHLAMLVRVKKTLTDSQRKKLTTLR